MKWIIVFTLPGDIQWAVTVVGGVFGLTRIEGKRANDAAYWDTPEKAKDWMDERMEDQKFVDFVQGIKVQFVECEVINPRPLEEVCGEG